ncbi:MAG: M3 family oligoendopeptidase [Bacteroidia bacterium]
MTIKTINIPQKPVRKFLPKNLVIDNWEKLLPYFENLKNRELNSLKDLEKWLHDRSELEAVLEEDMAWRYIKMNIDTTNKELQESFEFFVTQISPKIAPYDDILNRKINDCSYTSELKGDAYKIYLRRIKKSIELYREENIPIITQLQTDEQKYGAVCAAMTVEIDGKTLTLQQAAKYLKENDRKLREEVYIKINKRRLEDKEELNKQFNHLIELRHKMALNAGFKNYRDYKHEELGRFDYTVQDCFAFHDAIAIEVMPLINRIDEERKKLLQLDNLKPWDTEVDVSGKAPLKPFETGAELLEKTIKAFYRLDSYFGECIEIMKEMGHLDLDSRIGKAPGGFNYPLYEIGVPFIYMNAAGTLRDLVTMVHEGGHAIHSFLSRDLELTEFKSVPSEVAELASMGMELISMDVWDEFFTNEEDLKRAKKEQLEKVIDTLPWVAAIDKFQHWIYENPSHTDEERYQKWNEIINTFGSKVVEWTGLEEIRSNMWQKQLHLYEVPFYYIEYGMAQLGAIALWRNYKLNPEKTIAQYKEALKLGYTKSIGEIYKTAGIQFNFSREYVKELMQFISDELNKLSN